jgi:hypothetical protein
MVERKTLAAYEKLVYGLCVGPSGEDQDNCARQIVKQLFAMYVERGVRPSPGLAALAARLKVEINGGSELGE